jgi:hypothetical protein
MSNRDPYSDSPGPWLVGTTKVYSGVGADIVMESITLIENCTRPPRTSAPLARAPRPLGPNPWVEGGESILPSLYSNPVNAMRG